MSTCRLPKCLLLETNSWRNLLLLRTIPRYTGEQFSRGEEEPEPVAIDDVYLLTVSAQQLGSLRQNTLAFIATTEDDPEVADFAAIGVAIKDIHRATQHTTVTYSGWKARQIAGSGVSWPSTGSTCTPTGGLFFEGTFTTNQSGQSGAGDALPPQCALVTTLRSGLIGRSHRGRVYSYGYSESQQVGGVWAAVDLTAIDTAWNTFYAAYAVAAPASGYRLGIWSTRIASGCRVLPDGSHERTGIAHPELAFTATTAHVTRSTVFTQRRRVTGIGL